MSKKFSLRFLSLAGAACLSLMASHASAATLVFAVGDVTSGFFGNAGVKKGAFSDTLAFNLLEGGDFSASITSTATRLTKVGDIDFTSVVLSGVGGPFSFSLSKNGGATGLVDSASLNTFLEAGAYVLTITGFSYGNAQYGGNTTVTSVVPEPAAWAMMIGGFAGVGGLMRARRQRVAAA